MLSGKIGVLSESKDFSLLIETEELNRKLSLVLVKRPLNEVVLDYQRGIKASLKSKSKEVIRLSYKSHDPKLAVLILNKISDIYLNKNIQRSSAEIQGSLTFLQNKLPSVKAGLEQSEKKLNAFQAKSGSVDISSEAKVVLEQIVEIENKLADLQLKKTELDKKFTVNHPNYKAWLSQKRQMQKTKASLEKKVKDLPRTQQDIVRLMRDVKVGNQIYLSVLNAIQELDIAKAGTVGNVQILDKAMAYPVPSKRPLIILMFSTFGLLIPSTIILLRKFLNKGISSDDDLEKMHLPVYAVVPHSNIQEKILDKKKIKKKKYSDKKILALEYQNDVSVESLRSLRTSLHFGMLEAKNNVIMLTGPSPDVGKTFVSCNLSALIADADKKVLLIDADMRRGTIHKELNIDNQYGLSDILSKTKDFSEVILENVANIKDFDVLTRGSAPPNPSELLMGDAFNALIAFVSIHYDLVIVDTPPVLSVTDASIVGRLCGTSMLVVKHLHTTKHEIKVALANLEKSGVTIKGAVLNNFKQQESAYKYNYLYESEG